MSGRSGILSEGNALQDFNRIDLRLRLRLGLRLGLGPRLRFGFGFGLGLGANREIVSRRFTINSKDPRAFIAFIEG